MFNPEFIKSEMNPFMQFIRDHGSEDQPILVKMDNEVVVAVFAMDTADENGNEIEQHFRSPDYNYMWDVNGKSVESNDFNLIKIVGQA